MINPNDRVVVVGNGGSILKSEQGWSIDNYAQIVRFNNYKIQGYEKHVGTRTTIWFTCNCNKSKVRQKYQQVYFHSWEWDKTRCECWHVIKEYHKDVKEVPKGVCMYLGEQIPEYGHIAFSTGLIAITILLQQFNKLDLIGFDWHLDEYPHHYGDNEVRGTLHNPKMEYKYLQTLESAGKIKFI